MANNRDVFQHLDENIELFQGLMRGRWDRSDPGKSRRGDPKLTIIYIRVGIYRGCF